MLNRYKVVWFASLGVGMGFFDFTIYLLFATYLKQVFFPDTSGWIGLLAVFATFAVGYIILHGRWGVCALAMSVISMAVKNH